MSATASTTDKPAGECKLKAEEVSQQARARSCIAQKPENIANCKQVIFISIFFDGTNNNIYRDHPKKAHSNIACLFLAHRDEPRNGIFSHYIQGVGTAFSRVGEVTEDPDGKSQGAGGEARIHYGMVQVFNSIHNAVNGRNFRSEEKITENLTESGFWGKILNGISLKTSGTYAALTPFETKRNRKAYFDILEGKVENAIKGKKPEIELINISVFGFSRGAAQARAFCNWMAVNTKDSGKKLCGIPCRFRFLGIFDTVASVGFAHAAPGIGARGLNLAQGFMDWADGNMKVHDNVEHCVHFVAAHEQRIAFPLSSVRHEGKVLPNTFEKIYPGVHCDVGGGYAPGDHGKSTLGRQHLLSQEPLLDMRSKCYEFGVPLLRHHEMNPELQKDFTVDVQLTTRFIEYNNWVENNLYGSKQDSLEEKMLAHLIAYLVWRIYVSSFGRSEGTKSERALRSLQTLDSYRKASVQDKKDLEEAEVEFFEGSFEWVERAWGERLPVVGSAEKQSQIPLATPLDKKLKESSNALPWTESVLNFFDLYVHDSYAGFYISGPVTDHEKREIIKAVIETVRKDHNQRDNYRRAGAISSKSSGYPGLSDFENEVWLALQKADISPQTTGSYIDPTERARLVGVALSGHSNGGADRIRNIKVLAELEQAEIIFPLMTDEMIHGLRARNFTPTAIVQTFMSSTRRGSGGYFRERTVFDRS